jgi:hypothetical protein
MMLGILFRTSVLYYSPASLHHCLLKEEREIARYVPPAQRRETESSS